MNLSSSFTSSILGDQGQARTLPAVALARIRWENVCRGLEGGCDKDAVGAKALKPSTGSLQVGVAQRGSRQEAGRWNRSV